MPLKLQAHVDSRIWSLQSTVSFFFYRLYGTAKYYLRLNLVCRGCIFFKMWERCTSSLCPIKHDSLPRVPLCAHIRFAQNSFFVLRTKSSASMALTKKNNKKKTTTKQNNPPPPQKKNKIKTTTTTKKQQKNSNKQITKTDKTQQTNVALATKRAYKIYVTNVSVFLLFLFIVSSIWGKMVLKPYSGCHGFALIRLFFRGGFARSALLFNGCSLKS